jgi:hypothetical protein
VQDEEHNARLFSTPLMWALACRKTLAHRARSDRRT